MSGSFAPILGRRGSALVSSYPNDNPKSNLILRGFLREGLAIDISFGAPKSVEKEKEA